MDENTIKTMMSTGKDDYGTPQWLFDYLNSVFKFNIDLAASKWNKKVEKFYSIKDNSFKKKWVGNCWLNPPYSKPQTKCSVDCSKPVCNRRGYHLTHNRPGLINWVEAAHRKSERYKSTVVCLVPSRTDTKWFEIVWLYSILVCFIKGRLKFCSKNEKNDFSAPFPSCLTIFSGNKNIEIEIIANKLKTIGHSVILK